MQLSRNPYSGLHFITKTSIFPRVLSRSNSETKVKHRFFSRLILYCELG